MSAYCGRCGEDLKFDSQKGWVHQDGQMYKQKLVNGELVDDHCVLPWPKKVTSV